MALRLFSACLLTLGGSAAAAEPPAAAASVPASAALLGQVTGLIGDAPCDNQGQCHAVGIGTKPCGGPSGYLAWSDKTTDPNALRSAVEAHSRAQMHENESGGLASDCRVTPMPSAVCRPRAADGKKVCQLGQGGASSAI